jgi:hypothetical protein
MQEHRYVILNDFQLSGNLLIFLVSLVLRWTWTYEGFVACIELMATTLAFIMRLHRLIQICLHDGMDFKQ